MGCGHFFFYGWFRHCWYLLSEFTRLRTNSQVGLERPDIDGLLKQPYAQHAEEGAYLVVLYMVAATEEKKQKSYHSRGSICAEK